MNFKKRGKFYQLGAGFSGSIYCSSPAEDSWGSGISPF